MSRTRRLGDSELRVVGALMEKEQTTPDAYPMTVNALRGACNQKTNREPVTTLGEEVVRDALEALRKDVLVWRSAGARVERWEHRLASRWELNAQEKAIMTLLMLRGPQTPGELRTRSERMTSFASVPEVVAALEGMTRGDHPLVRQLSRQPGQRETRWAHLMAAPGTVAAAEAEGGMGSHTATVEAGDPVDPLDHHVAGHGSAREQAMPGSIGARVTELERRLARLEASVGMEPESRDGDECAASKEANGGDTE